MEKMTIEQELRADNPNAPASRIQLAADALAVYAEASANVRANGAIVTHPRTGAPMENPYLRIMQKTGDALQKTRGIKIDRVLALLRARA